MSKAINHQFTFSSQPLPLSTTIIEGFKLFSHSIWKTWYWAFLFQTLTSLPALVQVLEGGSQQKANIPLLLHFVLFVIFIGVHAFSIAFLIHRTYKSALAPDSRAMDSVAIVKERWRPIFLVATSIILITTLGLSILIAIFSQLGVLAVLIIGGVLVYVSILVICYCPLIIFDNASAVDSIKKSYLLVKTHWWETTLALMPPAAVGMVLVLFAIFVQKPSPIGALLSTIVISSVVTLLAYSLLLVQFNNLKLLNNEKGLGSEKS